MKIYEELEQVLTVYDSDLNLESLLRRLRDLNYNPCLDFTMFDWSFSLKANTGKAIGYKSVEAIISHIIKKEIYRLKQKEKNPLAGIDEYMTLGAIFDKLSSSGYDPGMYKRGDKWRAYVDCTTNTLGEGDTPKEATLAAIKTFLEKR